MRRLAAAAAFMLVLAGPATAGTMVEKSEAQLRALDKITGGSTDIVVRVGDPIVFGSLEVEVKTCFQAPPEEVPESAAFLKILSTRPVADETLQGAAASTGPAGQDGVRPVLFSGWMYASSPGLNALEHPVYDVWVIRCTAPDPVKLPEDMAAGDGSAPFMVPVEDPPGDEGPLN